MFSSWSFSWQFWALLSAAFAALTAIFAKIGIENCKPFFTRGHLFDVEAVKGAPMDAGQEITVADLRAAYARYPGDAAIDQLVTEMLALSPRFAEMWAEHEVEVRGPMLKHVTHPQAGPLEFECQVLHIAETGQRLIAYCAAPGSATAAAFRQLAGDTAPLRA